MRSASAKLVRDHTSGAMVASAATFSESALSATTSLGSANARSSSWPYVSAKKSRLPRFASMSVSSSLAVWLAVSSLPSRSVSTPTYGRSAKSSAPRSKYRYA